MASAVALSALPTATRKPPTRAVALRGRAAFACRASSSGDKDVVDFGAIPRGMGFPKGAGFAFGDADAATKTPTTPSSSMALFSSPLATAAPLFALAEGLRDDIKPSYFATLGLFVLSAPGLWSLVKRSAKSKVDRKTFEVAGPSATPSMPLDELAREIAAFFRRNNYVVADAGEVITFEGNIAPEKGTAAYITFCVAVGLLCIALVCSIALPGGNLWYSIALISPLSGTYYMVRTSRRGVFDPRSLPVVSLSRVFRRHSCAPTLRRRSDRRSLPAHLRFFTSPPPAQDNAGRTEKVKVKMVTADDDMTTDIIVEGDVEEIERMRRDLNLVEKGKVYVKGILEQ
jgi:hypothetical protein